jgi:hypothetical protein
VFPPVFQTLKASEDVKAIVGTNPPRIYAHGAAPQRPDGLPLDQPYVTWFVVTVVPHNNLSDLPPGDRVPVQIDCFHQTDAGIRALATAARDAAEPFAHMTGMPINEREPETKLFHVALTFDWLVGR